MKKLTKILSAMLVCLTVFSSLSLAAEGTLPQDETTTLQEESTTTQAETTLPTEEETTTPSEDVTTTSPTEEETTLPSEEETTVPKEEPTTTPSEDITTTTPEEETTQPEIVLPKAPTGLEIINSNYAQCTLRWDYDKTVDGCDIFLKVDDEWVYQETSANKTTGYVKGLLCCSQYEIGVRSFILVGEEKYYSEDIATIIYNTINEVPYTTIYLTRSYAGGMVFTWHEEKGISGYILYRRVDNKWKKIATIRDPKVVEYDYKFGDMEVGKSYKFGIKAFVKTKDGTKYSDIKYKTYSFSEIGKTDLTAKKITSSSVTLEWTKIEGAKGYKLYKYNSEKKKYEAVKTTSELTYTVGDLEASSTYRFRVRAYYKVDGKTKWCTYSDTLKITTESKSVKAKRISKYKKYFTDGDWSVKVSGLLDEDYGTYDYTLAIKGNKIFARYDFENNKFMRDFEYLIDADKEKVYVIFDDDKTYAILDDDYAYSVVYSTVMMGAILDMSDAKGVKARTGLYGGDLAIEEYYTSKDMGIKKTYTFYKGKPVLLEVTYEDGSTEKLYISKINDTPSSSVFKLPSGYKKVTY
jgi:hypothetical protein